MPNSEQIKKFIEALEDAGYEPKSYSGRGMFGKKCIAVSGSTQGDDDSLPVSEWEIAKALWYGVQDEEELNIPEPRQDSLGLGIVLYWPSYEWPKEESNA